jgi:hypothetical protein
LYIYINRDSFIEIISYNPNFNYIETLKSAPKYDSLEKTDLKFTYQESTDAELIALKEKYKLAEISGTGTDFEKSKNLLKWVHELIDQDGNSTLPKERSAMSLIEYAQNNKQGLNCRGLAIILNESLLSIGIKSRYIELIPKDLSIDSHIVVAAYIPNLDKWVFLDPSFNAYFLDNTKTPMSVGEVREALINNFPLKTNDDIESGSVVYTNYISKNIYRLGSPVNSSVGYDSNKEKSFILLNPKDDNYDFYHKPFTSSIIHNQATFWAKP